MLKHTDHSKSSVLVQCTIRQGNTQVRVRSHQNNPIPGYKAFISEWGYWLLPTCWCICIV